MANPAPGEANDFNTEIIEEFRAKGTRQLRGTRTALAGDL